MSFWEKTVNSQTITVTPEQVALTSNDIILDEEAMSELQEDPNLDIFEEEDENTQELMVDANLRLEQGRLYQMVLKHDLFGETDADPKAIKNVQREIRKFVKERLEIMLGIRQEQAAQTIVSSPFNDMEVEALKMVASKVTKGATEQASPAPVVVTPKKDGITSVSGNLRPKELTPLRRESKPVQKPTLTKKVPLKSALKKEEGPTLTKPISEMTTEELAAHDAAGLAARSKNYATMPNNLTPHPSPQALEMMYTNQAIQNPAPGSAVARMTDLINGRN